jgi:HipA N-terminal domain
MLGRVLRDRFYDEIGKLDISPIVKTTRVASFFSNLLPEGRLRAFVAQQAGVKSGRYCVWLATICRAQSWSGWKQMDRRSRAETGL